ncbi:hypothetical protein AKJ09_00420 [Labilithrix luteola]|uniref:DUF5666 domain-containing protein n=1 Tax=Labilithrix luteola TaxID=1391654 RepID=A0A0K1PK42_9BACT|nr:hypothetical protein [Labilithrix luteola]AKU93756.1 hypothetical protein AKJ09_00420 [Labilithrix luteola]
MLLLRFLTLLFSTCAGANCNQPAPPPQDPAAAQGEPVVREVTGRVVEHAVTLNGDLTGVVLEDRTRVHFPPAAGATLTPLLRGGRTVRVIGVQHPGPQGLVLEASSITSVDDGVTVNVPEAVPPAATHR